MGNTPSEMTTDFNKRTKLSTARMFISGLGTFLATFIPGQLFSILGQDNSLAFFINGAFLQLFLLYVCIFLSVLHGNEKFRLKNYNY
ncbi:MFS transporter [Niallia circulans]